jgi:hypothetical protein
MPILGMWASMGMYDVGPAKMRVGSGTYATWMNAYYARWLMRWLNGQTPRSQTIRSAAFPD